MRLAWRKARQRYKEQSPDTWTSGDPGRKERLRKKDSKELSEKMIRELRKIIQKEDKTWIKRKKKENDRIKEEDKQERLEKIKRKQKKFGKKLVGTKNNPKQIEENDATLRWKIEKAEIRSNLWRKWQPYKT